MNRRHKKEEVVVVEKMDLVVRHGTYYAAEELKLRLWYRVVAVADTCQHLIRVYIHEGCDAGADLMENNDHTGDMSNERT